MENPATFEDVEAVWRPLDDEEQSRVTALLDRAWGRLQIESPGVVDRIAAGSVPVEVVVDVLSSAVIRVAMNPERHRQGQVTSDDSSRSWTIDSSISSGELYFTDAELALVSGGRRRRPSVFSVMPS